MWNTEDKGRFRSRFKIRQSFVLLTGRRFGVWGRRLLGARACVATTAPIEKKRCMGAWCLNVLCMRASVKTFYSFYPILSGRCANQVASTNVIFNLISQITDNHISDYVDRLRIESRNPCKGWPTCWFEEVFLGLRLWVWCLHSFLRSIRAHFGSSVFGFFLFLGRNALQVCVATA